MSPLPSPFEQPHHHRTAPLFCLPFSPVTADAVVVINLWGGFTSSLPSRLLLSLVPAM
ncbi:hypothetical protein SOVF_205140 [Spinacia oleracea]|nr:hypothetical protein SOVF_205140 [Spinacia oleracea]